MDLSLSASGSPIESELFYVLGLNGYLPNDSELERLPLLRSVSPTPAGVFSTQGIGLGSLGIQVKLVKARTSNPEFLSTLWTRVGGEISRRFAGIPPHAPKGGG